MSANPYTPPLADITDASAGVDRPGPDGQAPFFAVSLKKLALLSTCSLGFYQLYWFYKNWALIRDREGVGLSPAARTFFSMLWCYSCFARIRDGEKAAGVSRPFSAGLQAMVWIAASLSWRLPDNYFWVGLLSVLPILNAQWHVNRLNLTAAPAHDRNAGFSVWNWILVVAGGLLMLLAIVGSFVPDEQ